MNCTTSSLGTRSGSSVVPSLPFELAEADGNAADPSDPQPQHTSSSPSLPRYCNSSKPRSGQVSESPQALRFRPEKVACSHTEKSNLFNCDSGSRCLEFAGWSWLWASDEVSTHHPQIDEAASAADIRSGVTSASVNIEQNNKFGMNLVGCLPAVSSTAYSSAGAARVVPALSPDGMLDPTCLQAGSTQCGSVRWSSEDGPAKNSTGSSASVVVTTRTPPEHYSTASRARNTTGKWASPAIAIAAVTLMALSTAGVEAQDGVPDVDDSIPQTCTLLEIWGNQGHFSQYINGKFHVGHDEGDGLIANGRDAYQKVRDPAATTPQPDMFLIHEKGKWCITFYVKTTQTMAGMGCFDQDVFNPGDITEPLMIAGAADVNTKVACRKFAFATEEGPVHNEL